MPTAIQAYLLALLTKIGVPAKEQQTIIHVVVVFVSAFVVQLLASHVVGSVNWPTVWALVSSAAIAGGSAALHYLTGLLPAAKPPADKK